MLLVVSLMALLTLRALSVAMSVTLLKVQLMRHVTQRVPLVAV